MDWNIYGPPSFDYDYDDDNFAIGDIYDSIEDVEDYYEESHPPPSPLLVRAIIVSVKAWLRERDAGAEMTPIPWSVLEGGPLAVEAHYRSLGKTMPELVTYHYRVGVIGSRGSGKTKLVQSMRPTCHSSNNKTIGRVGIDVVRVKYPDSKHDIAFWDVPGGEIFEGALSRLFTEQTLFLICVDLDAYAKRMKGKDGMDRFVSEHVFKWVQLVFSRFPKAKVQVVGTKQDLLKSKKRKEVMADFRDRLQSWQKRIYRVISSDVASSPSLLEEMARRVGTLLTNKWMCTSCKDAERTRERVLSEIVSTIACQVPFGYNHKRVWRTVQRHAKKIKGKAKIVESVDDVCINLAKKTSDLSVATCRDCLDDLHTLGKLWFFPKSLGTGVTTPVFLSPMVITRCLGMIIKYAKQKDKEQIQLRHDEIITLRLWNQLDADEILHIKSLLHYMQLAYPSRDATMDVDSDLIVPGCWSFLKNQTRARRLHPQQSLLERNDIRGKSMICWEYEVSVELSDTLFKRFACISGGHGERTIRARDVFQDCAHGDIVVNVSFKPQTTAPTDTIRIEIMANDAAIGWRRMLMYVSATESILVEYPGLRVARYTIENAGQSPSEEIYHKLRELISLLEKEQQWGKEIEGREKKPWLPPKWWLAAWHDRRATHWQQLDSWDAIDKKLDAIHTSIIADPTLRLFPAVWTLECSEDGKQLEVRMLSDYSFMCFQPERIVLEVPPKFLSDHGGKIQVGLSILSNVVPELISMGVL